MNASPHLSGRSRLGRVALVCMLGAVTAAGCTLVNSFGELKQSPADTGPGGTDAKVDSTGTDSNVDTGVDTNVPPTDTNDAEVFVPRVDNGLIVIEGEVSETAGKAQVLSVLDPLDGSELAREHMVVSAIAYDGLNDLWFIFENTTSGFNPLPGDVIKLHVRQWDVPHGKWLPDLSTATVPTPATSSVVVLHDELAYVAYRNATFTDFSLALVDTLDAGPAKKTPPTPLSKLYDLSALPLSMAGVPKSTSGSGGDLTFLFRQATAACTGTGDSACNLLSLHAAVPVGYADPVFDATPKVVGTISKDSGVTARAGTGIGVSVNSVMVTIPRTDVDSNGTVIPLNPRTSVIDTPPATFKFPMTTVTSKALNPPAISDCHDGVLFIPELLSSRVFVVPVKAPLKTLEHNLTNAAQAVAWEPYTETLIAPFASGSFEIAAWSFTIDVAFAPTMTKRKGATWHPPTDLSPNLVRTKISISSPPPCK